MRSALADRRLMALAGLWETWRSPAGERVRSFAIVTTPPNRLLAELHDRMPVILAPEHWPAWLGERAADPEELRALLGPYPAEDMVDLAGRPAGRQRQEQGSVADRAGGGSGRGAAVFANSHISEDRLGHLAHFVGRQVAAPCLDAHRHRGAPGSHERAVAAHLVADEHRLVEDHGVDRHGGAPPSRALRRQTASGEIHLGEQPSAEDVAVWVGVGRHRDDAHQRQGRRKPARPRFPPAARFIAGSRGASIGNVNKISRDGEGGQ